ncbi:MAG TPA: AMP-binding protein [Desulfomonilaceae bacterium]|nr:AMP-binding protein [Desulfomonilaceae bacterium]
MFKAVIPPENPDANLKSYKEAYANFSWEDIEKEFTWHETGDINMAYEAVDRWAENPDTAGRRALIFEKSDKVSEFTYLELKEISSQWANLFIECGFAVGDRMFIFMPSCPEYYFAMLACARLGIIFNAFFTTLGFDEIDVRLQNAKPRGIIVHPDMVERLPTHAMASVEYVFLTEGEGLGIFQREIAIKGVVGELPKRSQIKWLTRSTPFCLLYTTSGSTRPPKGVVHTHGAMVGHLATARYVLDVHERSVIWTDAGEPGWVTSIIYGAFAPWLCGATTVVQGDQFAASTWYRTLERHQVDVCYTTPRTITRLMEAGEDLPLRYNFSHLRHIATVGEVLSPEQFYWARHALKHSPHDTWWMTETGMICIANFPSMTIRPGSMGKPVPGVEAAVVDENGEPLPILTMGELALRPGWPSMMTAIWEDEERYRNYFRGENLFFTGDMVTKDEDGYYYHQGRNDDLIKVGQRDTGPYEVEQVLSLHQAVAEAVVISTSSPVGRTTFKAFLRLKSGYTSSNRLNLEIKNFVKANFSPDLPLSEIVFLDELPKTRSGIMLQRALMARELGLPIGDPRNLQE